MRFFTPARHQMMTAACIGWALLHYTPAPAQSGTSDLRLHIAVASANHGSTPPVVIWINPLGETPRLTFPIRKHYALLQKNRMFIPHLLVIPVGTTVDFPNADPFFHNVFSLFDGKRFDLGLYEAGSDKQVVFSREGVSYIFCNIHPEMSAVVLALSTPLYGIADSTESVAIHSIPSGDYNLNVWVEGVPQAILSGLTRRIHLSGGTTDLGSIAIPVPPATTHTNKFGKSYDTPAKPPY
jgi:hypothetical protein